MFLIIGCGRSGTKYISNLLRVSNLDVGHEVFGKDGVVSWEMTPDDGGFSCGIRKEKGKENKCDFNVIIHQVRDPLKQIRSFLTVSRGKMENGIRSPWWDYIGLYTSVIPTLGPTLHNCMKYYYEWNKIAENRADWRFRIENIDKVYDKLCYKLNITPNFEILSNLSRTLNERRKVGNLLTWDDLYNEDDKLCEKIHFMANMYGYT